MKQEAIVALSASGPRYCGTLIGLICFRDGAENFPVPEKLIPSDVEQLDRACERVKDLYSGR